MTVDETKIDIAKDMDMCDENREDGCLPISLAARSKCIEMAGAIAEGVRTHDGVVIAAGSEESGVNLVAHSFPTQKRISVHIDADAKIHSAVMLPGAHSNFEHCEDRIESDLPALCEWLVKAEQAP